MGSGGRRSSSVVDVVGVVERLAVEEEIVILLLVPEPGYPLLVVGGILGSVVEFPDAERVRSRNRAAFSGAVEGGVIAGVIDIGVAAEPRRGFDEEREKSLGMRPSPRVEELIVWWLWLCEEDMLEEWPRVG